MVLLSNETGENEFVHKLRAKLGIPVVGDGAGLKGILTDKLGTDSVGLFVFGEVCSGENFSEFGNLMLSKIVIKKK